MFVSLLKEFDENFNIASTVSDFTHQAIIRIVHNNRDFYYEIGAARSMFDFKYLNDTGKAKAVCRRQSIYCVHEEKNMT